MDNGRPNVMEISVCIKEKTDTGRGTVLVWGREFGDPGVNGGAGGSCMVWLKSIIL